MIRTKLISSSGIYQIRSRINGKRYIGSAVNLIRRKYEHFESLNKGMHYNLYLQRHVNKYGIKDLIFGMVESCSKEKLIEREQYYINTLIPEFNLCKKAYSTLGIKHPHSEDTKQRLRLTSTGNQNNLGRHPSEKVKQKISESVKKTMSNPEVKAKIKGREFSEVHLQNISLVQKERYKNFEARKQRSKGQTKLWQDSEYRRRMEIAHGWNKKVA